MDLRDFIPSNNKPANTLISGDVDPEKYQKIATTLCEKRKAIEKKLENKELESAMREELALDLYQLKQDMLMFGISEITYQAYLAQEPEQGSDQQLPFL